MRKFTRKDAIKQVTKTISDLTKKGLNIDIALGGKSIEQNAFNQKAFNQFKKQVKRARERPKIEQQVQTYDILRQQKKERKVVQINDKLEKETARKLKQRQQYKFRNTINDKTEAIVKFNLNMKNITKKAVREQTKQELQFVQDKYFKELKGTKHELRLKSLLNRFGTRLDLAHKFIDYIAQKEFEYPYEKDVFKNSFFDDYYNHMVNRLNDFEKYVKNTLNL